MITDQNFCQMRKRAFNNWCSKQHIPGLTQQLFDKVFETILSQQAETGTWQSPGTNWEVVQTAVVLKCLATLEFSAEDQWQFYYGTQKVNGCVSHPLQFLCAELKNKGTIGEDIWDTCQALLALAAFHREEEGLKQADRIRVDWETLYVSECESAYTNQWCGPAYLAAMIDVLLTYQGELSTAQSLSDALAKLKTHELVAAGKATGAFQASSPSTNMDRWNTGLVLRTLCAVAKVHPELIDRVLVERTAEWLLRELDQGKGWAADTEREPMYRSRCLEGLHSAIPFVRRELSTKIEAALVTCNQRIEQLLNEGFGGLKTYTAVGEYLACLTVTGPAAVIFQIGPILDADSGTGSRSQVKLQLKSQLTPGGIRIAWLSDLHVANVNDEQPSTMNAQATKWFGAWFGNFKYVRGTKLTQRFQEQKLAKLLARVEELRPDHILVTGDLTNYGKREQFMRVRQLFLGTQRKVRDEGPTAKLDPIFWTILPGNHDITDEDSVQGKLRHNLGMFFSHFADTYTEIRPDYDQAFPLLRKLGGKPGGITVHLIGLDSNVEWPVSVVGFNARGRIDDGQMDRLAASLSSPRVKNELTIVALHHHPIVVPDMISNVEDHFLSLDEATGRRLVALCATTGVSAILHGHFHKFSMWSGLVPQGTGQIQIIGAPTGTMNIPEIGEEFLELREAQLGDRTGLALYSQRWEKEDWTESYITFIG
jgi:3',5'-cyclic AMP phosphodiesterase CpdA